MVIERKPSRYAHAQGHTDVCYSLDGSKIITCGSDGDVRVWSGFDDEDPVQTCIGEWALCVRQKDSHLYIATDNNDVQLITYPENSRDGVLIRSTAHVSHMALREEHDFVAVVSEDMEVRLINIKNREVSYNFEGVSGPPLSVALSHDMKLIAVSCGDGYLRIWNVEDQTLLKEIKGVAKTNSFLNAKLLARMDFHPKKSSDLAYPQESAVVVLNTEDWREKNNLSCYSVSSSFSIVQYSFCGEYLGAATLEGDIVVWEMKTETVVGISTHPNSTPITAMSWNPKNSNEIVFCDKDGQLGLAVGCSNQEFQTIVTEQRVEEEITSEVEPDSPVKPPESEDEDGENVISIEKLKRDILGDDAESELRSVRSVSPPPRPRTPEKPLQPPFMPGSTPEHLNPRYLCWNEVGMVRSYGDKDEDGENECFIEAEFHDTSVHNTIMLKNFQGYYMASLSLSALAVANTSQMNVILFSSGSKEWSISVTDEDITLIACSTDLVCVATSTYLLRIFSLYGIQKAVMYCPGPPLTMSAYSFFLLVSYHNAGIRKDDYCVNTMIFKLEGMKIERKDIGSALGPSSELLWLGFTNMGTPAMHNSLGMLSVFPLQSNIWIPVCDTSKSASGVSDGFFVTAVDEFTQTVRGVRCKGSHYPSCLQRSYTSELPILPPFAEMNTEKAQLEAQLFAWSQLRMEKDKKFKEYALKSFALAAKSNIDKRAVEFVQMLEDPQILQLAIKYATKQNNNMMAAKLMVLAKSMLKDSQQEEESLNSEISMSITPNCSPSSQPTKKLVLFSTSKIRKTSKFSVDRDGAQKATVEIDKENKTEVQMENESSQELFTDENSQIEASSSISQPKKNPFLKQQNGNDKPNPLSLTDKNAGVHYEINSSKRKNEANMNSEKRKAIEEEVDQHKVKQRKVSDMFKKFKND